MNEEIDSQKTDHTVLQKMNKPMNTSTVKSSLIAATITAGAYLLVSVISMLMAVKNGEGEGAGFIILTLPVAGFIFVISFIVFLIIFSIMKAIENKTKK